MENEVMRPGSALRVPRSFELFFFLLAFYAARGDRSCLKPLLGDLFPAKFADAIGAVIDPLERLLDFCDELSFPVLDPEKKIPVRLKRSPVSGVREVLFLFAHPGNCFSRAAKKLFELSV